MTVIVSKLPDCASVSIQVWNLRKIPYKSYELFELYRDALTDDVIIASLNMIQWGSHWREPAKSEFLDTAQPRRGPNVG